MDKLKVLQIETTNYCTNACSFCPHEKICNKGFMDFELFKSLVDQGKEMGVEKIAPFLNGEPFMDPNYFEKLKYVREVMPNVWLEIFTNGSILDDEKIDQLALLNVNFINVSVNAASKDIYEKICKRNHFDKVVENTIKLINRLSSKTVIRVSMVPTEVVTNEEIEKFKEFWSKYLPKENIQINEYFNWSGKIYKNKQTIISSCFRILEHLTVQYDGKVIWCCMDIGDNPDYIIGDLTKQTLKEVWEKSEWRRLMHKQSKRIGLEPCFKCGNKS